MKLKKFNEMNRRETFQPNYGLMVVDPRITDHISIIHYCAFENEPTQKEIDHLREELRTDEDFGMGDEADIMEILPATEEVVEHFRKEIEENEKNIHGDEIV